jgi:hypothetical protein
MRKSFGLIVATAALCVSVAGMSSSADAMYKKKHHHHNNGGVSIGIGLGGYPMYDSGYGYDGYGYGYGSRYAYNDYYDEQDCRYRRVAVKKWNRSHTHRFIVYRKRLVCY